MIEPDRRMMFAGGAAGVLLIGIAIFALTGGNTMEGNVTDWKNMELNDVRTGESFTISELEKPVLVETFAVWCPTCTRQQQEIKKLHQETGISSVSLDVDPNEDRGKVRRHIQEHGFDWYYAVAPSDMTRALVNQYGNSMAHPPSAPAVLVCENATRKLPNGVKPVSKLKQEVEKGC